MKPIRILIVRLGAMGDVLHTLPAAASLKQSFPHSHIAWVIEQKWAALLQGNPFIDEVTHADRHSIGSVLALRRHLQSTKWDLAVDFQGLIKSALAASFARPERIVGFHRSELREKLAALFYSAHVRTTAQHVVDRNLELAFGAGASNVVRSSFIPEGQAEGELPGGDFVLANPQAGWASKQWPLENYVELAKRLCEFGHQLVLNVAAPLHGLLDVRQHVSGLPGLIHATRKAVAIVGVDSGPLHLAAALGKPGVAIFGPTNPDRHGPYGGTISVLRSKNAVTSYKRGTEIDRSMREISVDQVFAALRDRVLCPV